MKAGSMQDGIIGKADKPAFEALEAISMGGQTELLLFGSGSKSPQRDLFIRMSPSREKAETWSLTGFYNHLRSSDVMQGSELNIEAVALDESRLLLFNRKKNVLFIYPLTAFLDYLRKGTAYPEPELVELLLPQIDGIEAGISGATIIPGARKIIFTASVENTPNAIDDGEVLGSFVGIIDLEQIKKGQKPPCVLVMEGEQSLRVKVESVTIHHQRAANEVEILLVTDSDGNESEIISAVLKWK